MAQPRNPNDRASTRGARRRVRRLWCLPPAVTREPGEVLEGMHVLDEFPGDAGLALWTALRDVMLWAATPDDRRGALFSTAAEVRRREQAEAAGVDAALELSLATLATVVSHGAQANAEVIALVCLEVARWARDRGGMGTAVSYAQAAATAWPNDAGPALAVGRFAVEWGRLDRAETWLRRAVGLGRRRRDWEPYGAAYVALGEIALRRERLDAAARYYTQASRVARRQQLRGLRGEAMHGLMRVSMLRGELESAARQARIAQRAYGGAHPRMPDLLHDVVHLLVRLGEHARAVPMLRRQLAVFTDAPRRLSCYALLARAAAELQDDPLYERSWTQGWALLDASRGAELVPEALRQLGKAAARASDWLRVQQTVRAFNELRADLRHTPAAADLEEIAAMAADHRAR